MLVLVVLTSRRFPAELLDRPVRTDRPSRSRTRPSGDLAHAPGQPHGGPDPDYQLLSAAVTQLLDYMVWERAAARFPDPSALAQFQGLFGAVINFLSVSSS